MISIECFELHACVSPVRAVTFFTKIARLLEMLVLLWFVKSGSGIQSQHTCIWVEQCSQNHGASCIFSAYLCCLAQIIQEIFVNSSTYTKRLCVCNGSHIQSPGHVHRQRVSEVCSYRSITFLLLAVTCDYCLGQEWLYLEPSPCGLKHAFCTLDKPGSRIWSYASVFACCIILTANLCVCIRIN